MYEDEREMLMEKLQQVEESGFMWEVLEINELLRQITKQNDRKRDTRTDDKE